VEGDGMSTKEIQESLVDNMKRWQKIENASIASTGKIIEKTENPVIRQVMEIIQQDSSMHYRVQGLIASSLEEKAISLTPEELAEIWELVEQHLQLEKKTIELAEEALGAIKGKKMVVQEYLLHYLLTDETKHDALLASLNKIKSGMYPYG
jgi:hypothetical protein